VVREGRILIQALVSEKATELQEKQNCYVFKVAKNANKIEIKEAVEKGFNVSVTSVTVANVKGKTKRLGRFEGKRAGWRKAFVSLKEGESIELFESV
jgi:large subunit ribosomal protein L23